MKHTGAIEQKIFLDINTRIATLEKDIRQLQYLMQATQYGVQQSHAALVGDMTNLMIRVNFITDILKEQNPSLETKFAEYDKIAREKMKEDLNKAIEEMKKKKEEAANKTEPTNVVQ